MMKGRSGGWIDGEIDEYENNDFDTTKGWKQWLLFCRDSRMMKITLEARIQVQNESVLREQVSAGKVSFTFIL